MSDEPVAPIPPRAGWVHGSTINKVDRTIRYTSVSAITLAKNCLRRYVYSYAWGIKDPPSVHTERGTTRHTEMETYLKTGSRAHMSQQALQGIPFVPDPGADLCVEQDLLKFPHEDVVITSANSAEFLKRSPLKIAGIPLLGAIDVLNTRGTSKDEGIITIDPPGTVEVGDHKFPNKNNGLKSNELIDSVQMVGYAKWAFNVLPETKLVRLSHQILPVTGTPRKPSVLVDQDLVGRKWELFEAVGRSMKDAIKEPDVHKVDMDENFCFSYGRPCPAKGKCKGDTLAELIGVDAAASVLEETSSPLVQITRKNTMPTVAERLAAARAATPAPTPTVASEIKRIAREDTLAKFPDFADLLFKLESFNMGFPVFAGEIAQAKSDLEGTDYKGGALAGSAGALAEYKVETVADLREMVASIAADMGDVPVASQATQDDVVAATAAIVEAVEPKKRGRKAKDETVHMNDAVDMSVVAPTAVINLYVDCLPSVAHESFWPIVSKIMVVLANDAGVSDVRLADQNSKYGFGRWKAALAACLRETTIVPGHYVLDGSFGEIAQEVISVMRERAVSSGGLFVRGVR